MEKLTAYNKKGSHSKENTIAANNCPTALATSASLNTSDNNTLSWDEQVSLENIEGFSENREDQNNELDASNYETCTEEPNNNENSATTTATRVNPYVMPSTDLSSTKVNKSKETSNRI
jgi:hypothetical protein